jgi:YD repeat-containing protein
MRPVVQDVPCTRLLLLIVLTALFFLPANGVQAQFTAPAEPGCFVCGTRPIEQILEDLHEQERERAEKFAEENAQWFQSHGLDASIGRTAWDYMNYPVQPMFAPTTLERSTVTTAYELGNQEPLTIRMGPATLTYRGARVQMIEGFKVDTIADDGGVSQSCKGSFNWIHASSGWADLLPDPNRVTEGDGGGLYVRASLKGYLTRVAVRTFVDNAKNTCNGVTARYVYRYQYHAPDGGIIAFYQRPREVPGTSFPGGCGHAAIPAAEPNFYWSSDGNTSLDTSNKCKPVIRWADGSTEEFHAAITEPPRFDSGDVIIGPAFEPSCSTQDATADLRRIDANGNITTYRYSTAADGRQVETMTDPQGRLTVLTYDEDPNGMPRLRSVELPSIGNAPAFRYSITWRTLDVRFNQIWPDVTCSPESGTGTGCASAMIFDVVDNIVIPDGRQYVFEYGPWGNLVRVSEPEGAVSEFEYGGPANVGYANAVLPLVNRIDQSDACGTMWSGEAVKMQARGLVRTRLYPEGRGTGKPVFGTTRNFSLRKLTVPGCVFDDIGAGVAGPDGCSQVWMETTHSDGTLTKTGHVTRALSRMIPGDDRFAVPPTVPVPVHGRFLGEETWSGPNLVEAKYNGDKETGALWYESEFVKAVRLPYALPAHVRAIRERNLRDGLFTTTNFVYGDAIDIDPGSGVESRVTAPTMVCTFAGIVDTAGCSPANATALLKSETTYLNYFDGSLAGRHLLSLPLVKKGFGPDATGKAFSTVPLIETTNVYDEFDLTASHRPAGSLDGSLGLAAGSRRGNLTSMRQRVSATKTVTAQTKYYDTGQLQAVIDNRGATTTYDVDFRLCSAAPRLTLTVTNPLGHVSSQVTDCLSGLVLRATAADGNSSYIQYNALAEPVEKAGPEDFLTPLPQTGPQAYTRDPAAPTGSGTAPGQAAVGSWIERLGRGVVGQQRTVTHLRDGSPDGHYTKMFTDGLGRVIQTRTEVDPAKTGFAETVATTVYDGIGRVAQAFVPCFGAASNIVTTPCGSASTITAYDVLGRPVSVTMPGNRTTTYAYSAENGRWLTTAVDPRGFTTKTYSNLLEQIVEVDEQSERCGGFCSTTAKYDAVGRLLHQADPAGNEVVYTYDDLGRRLTMNDPDMGHWSYEYDENGNLTAQTDAIGQRIELHYDALNRLTLKDLPPTGPSAEDVKYFYDGNGPVPPAEAPAPTIAGIQPSAREANSGAFTLTVTGSNFTSRSIVRWNGADRQTTFVSAQQLAASILASDVQTSGSFSVSVADGSVSNSVAFVVNSRPTVTLTSPTNGQVFSTAPATIPLRASVVDDSDGLTVRYFNGSTQIGSSNTPPSYAFDWTGVTAGSYTLRANVTDRFGSTADSGSVTVNVSTPPTVRITSPASGQAYPAPATVTITAEASGAAPIARVVFLSGNFILGQVTTAPYTFTWNNVPAGIYELRAEATDVNGSTGASTNTAVISVSAAQTCTLLGPSSGAEIYAPATLGFRVTANSPSGEKMKDIALYANNTLLFRVLDTFTLNYTWNNVPAGNYHVVAVATNYSNLAVSSAPIDIVVQTRPANLASFVSQVVPASMIAGHTYDATVTMQNDGTATWTAAGNYRLGSQNPQDNTTWGLARVNLPASTAPNAQVTFRFSVTAPSTPGSYVFQWEMVQDGVAWFAKPTTPVTINVLSAAQGSVPVNYALNRVANQTTAATGDFAADAHRAVDGNTNGNYAAGSVTQTETYDKPFWQVPISGPNVVNQIDIWNRTDCCSERLANFYVFVSADYVMSNDPVTASRQPGVWSYFFSGPAPAHVVIPVPGVTANWVRVQLAGTGILSLAEVQVWNTATTALTNATQSSTMAATPPGDAFRAADGNTNGDYPAGSVTQTNSEVQPWWQAEMSASTGIDHIDVWNRVDCCSERLNDFYLFVSDTPFASPNLAATLSQPGVSAYRRTGVAGQVSTIRVNRTGRYVRVQLASAAAGILSLAEVQVFAGTVMPPPVVSMTSPTNGQILYPAPATVPLRASVSGGRGTATVNYYRGTTLIGSSSTGPSYSSDWANVAEGDYTLKAVVADANGDTAESATITALVRQRNNAQFIAQSVPSSMIAGATYTVTVTLQNSGGATWTAADNYKLGSQSPQDNTTWGLSRVALPGPVAYGAQTTFSFNVTAPSAAGTYTFQWRMLQDGAGSFGAATPPVSITVAAPRNGATFVTQSIPTSMVKGRSYSVSITMRNSGTTDWTVAGGYKLGSQSPQDNTTWGGSRVALPGTVPAGAQVTFSFVVIAPSTPGTYAMQTRMIQEGVEWFGDLTPLVNVTVTDPPSSGLIAAWKLDEFAGNTTADATGNGSTGTLLNDPLWIEGRTGAGLQFSSAAKQTVRIAPSARLAALANDFTISFWVYPGSTHEIDVASTDGTAGTTGQKYVFGPRFESNSDSGVGISVGTNGISVYEHATSYMPALLVYPAPIDGWTHVAVVYKNKQPSLYVNGTLVRVGLTSPRLNVHAVPVDIGGMTYGYYDGWLDDVGIHDHALSAAEIASLSRGLVARWPLTEGSGTTAADSSGNGNNLTLRGGASWTAANGGSVLALDGASGYAQVSYGRTMVMNRSLTFSAWLYAASASQGTLVSKEGEYAIGLSGGTLRFMFNNDNPGWNNWIDTHYVVPLQRWLHVTVVYDTGLVKTYVNGAPVSIYPGEGPIRPTGVDDFRIGGRLCCSEFFNGQLSDVRLYDQVLSPLDVQALDEIIWMEDGVPAGATALGDSWDFINYNTEPGPYSGALALRSASTAGTHQNYFAGATQTLSVGANDVLVAHVYLDPASPPSEIMLQWNDGTWDHRAYWGADNIPFGAVGTVARKYMGPLPPAGRWVRLEIPAAAVGLAGRVLTGMAFTEYDGRVVWDHAGLTHASQADTTFKGPSLVTGAVLGTPRNDFSGAAGMKFTTGAQPVTVRSLGRMYLAGNSDMHALKLVRASDGTVVAAVDLLMLGGTVNEFKYADLPAPVTLTANTSYYLTSSESFGRDQWYDGDTAVTPAAVVTIDGPVSQQAPDEESGFGVQPYVPVASPNHAYVPVDLKYQP